MREGYVSAYKNILFATMGCSAFLRTGGPNDVDLMSNVPVVMQVWGYVNCIINSCSDKMKLVLERFGVDKDVSFFCKTF